LDRQHHLVNALGVQYLDSQRLSRYRFRHNLFQKYLYHSLDEIEKAHLNEAVGSALEALYGGQAQEEIAVVAGQLARHFEAAGQVSKAINYLQLAGDAAACLYACAEAIAYYRRALKLIQHSQVSDSQISHLFSHLGRVLELDSQFEQALAYYEKMEQLAKQCGDCAMELAALIARINLLAVPTPVHDPAQGRILGEKALTLARELGDKEAEAKILWDLVNACQYTTGGLSQAIAYGEHALALARELDLHEQMAYTLTDISYCYWESFRFDQARRSLHEAEKLWREIGNLPMLANSLSTACQISVSAGTFDEALTYSEEAYHISKSIDNLWGQSFSRMVIGNVYWERGLPEQAIAMMKNSICLGKKAGFVVPQIITRSDLALMYGDLGMLTQGLEIAQLALSIAKKKFPIFCIIPLGALARLHLRNGNFAKAEEAINAGKNDPSLETFPIEFIPIYLAEAELALAQDNYQYVLDLTSNMLTDMRQCDMRYYIPHVLYLQSQALIALEQPGTARASLLEACKLAEALNARRALWPILFTLSQLETEPAESECLRRQAQKIIEYIAVHTGTPELRDSFLGLTNVQVVFEPSR
jgi:tetratricopeptide (TPR) repeat protein